MNNFYQDYIDTVLYDTLGMDPSSYILDQTENWEFRYGGYYTDGEVAYFSIDIAGFYGELGWHTDNISVELTFDVQQDAENIVKAVRKYNGF